MLIVNFAHNILLFYYDLFYLFIFNFIIVIVNLFWFNN